MNVGSASLTLVSQTHVPMFYQRAQNASPTTLNLTWVNFALTRYPVTGTTSSKNCGSDHHLLLTKITLDTPSEERTHNTAKFETMAKTSFCEDLQNQLSSLPHTLRSIDKIYKSINHITESINGPFLRQGKTVKPKTHRHLVG